MKMRVRVIDRVRASVRGGRTVKVTKEGGTLGSPEVGLCNRYIFFIVALLVYVYSF